MEQWGLENSVWRWRREERADRRVEKNWVDGSDFCGKRLADASNNGATKDRARRGHDGVAIGGRAFLGGGEVMDVEV